MNNTVTDKNNLFTIILASFIFVFALLPKFIDTIANLNSVKPEGYLTLKSNNLTGNVEVSDDVARFEGNDIVVPQSAFSYDVEKVLSLATEERWIEIDLSEQKLRAWEGNGLFLETLVSSGLPGTPTPQGEFWIWIKLRATKMEGGQGRYYYYLPNVPYTMFFYNASVPKYKGYGLHGTYWHSDFGTQRSHGCVNLPTPVAKELYYWTNPVIPDGKSVVYSSDSNPGTRVVIHQ